MGAHKSMTSPSHPIVRSRDFFVAFRAAEVLIWMVFHSDAKTGTANMARSSFTWTCLACLLLTFISLTSSLPPPFQPQPTPPLLSLVIPTSTPRVLAVGPTDIPVDPYLITVTRGTYIYFGHYANPHLGSPSSLVGFIRKLREQCVREANTHGGARGELTHFDFSRQQGGFVINFVVDWEPRQEEKKVMLTYERLATIVAGMDNWRTRWGRSSKVMGCEFTYEEAQDGQPVQMVVRGRWWASPAGTGVMETLARGSEGNVTLLGGGGAEGEPAVVETTRKRLRGRSLEALGVKTP